MQRKIPLKRKTPLKRTALVRKASNPIKRTAKPKQKSAKRITEEAEYRIKSKAYLVNHPLCQAALQGICTRQSGEIHHRKGRIGKLYLDENYFLAVCRSCHRWIEDNVLLAKDLGLSVSRLSQA